tara:strand:- start:48 stop:203 length:156 start_codon:yes stop_codon:yes gene_type:complete
MLFFGHRFPLGFTFNIVAAVLFRLGYFALFFWFFSQLPFLYEVSQTMKVIG